MLRLACLVPLLLLLAACGLRLDGRGPAPSAEFSRDHPLLTEPAAHLEVAQVVAPRLRLAPPSAPPPSGEMPSLPPAPLAGAQPVEASPLPPATATAAGAAPATRVIVPQVRREIVPQARTEVVPQARKALVPQPQRRPSGEPPPLRPFPSLWPRPGEAGGAASPPSPAPVRPPTLLVPPAPAAPAAAVGPTAAGGTTIFVDGQGARPMAWPGRVAPVVAVVAAPAPVAPPPPVAGGTWVVDGRGARLETWSDERGQERAQPLWQEAVLRDAPAGTAGLVAAVETRVLVPQARQEMVPQARKEIVPATVAAPPLERPQPEWRRIAFAALSAAVPAGADLGVEVLKSGPTVEVTGLAAGGRGLAPSAAERLAMNRAVAVRRALVAAGVAPERIRLMARVAADDAVLLRVVAAPPPSHVTAAGRSA